MYNVKSNHADEFIDDSEILETLEYAEKNTVMAERIYLSLGDKEERTRNPVMRTVGDNIRRQYELLQADMECTGCILEMNPGNHFKETDIRTAKGFAWLLKH